METTTHGYAILRKYSLPKQSGCLPASIVLAQIRPDTDDGPGEWVTWMECIHPTWMESTPPLPEHVTKIISELQWLADSDLLISEVRPLCADLASRLESNEKRYERSYIWGHYFNNLPAAIHDIDIRVAMYKHEAGSEVR